jgi:transcription elongation factor GreA
MTDRPTVIPQFTRALDEGEWERVEELWLEALDAPEIPTEELLELRRLLWKAGEKTLAQTLLELLAESLEEREDFDAAVLALREQVRLSKKPDEALLARLEGAVSAARADSPSVREVLARHRLTESRRPVEALAAIERWLDHDRGTIVEVIGQGVGRVVDLNLELENIKVDVGGRRPVSVPIGAVPRYLRPLPAGDFRRRKVERPDRLEAFVLASPGDALVELLESLGEAADVATIKTALDGLLPPESWTTWWGKARKHPRLVTSGSGSRLRYTVGSSAEEAAGTLLEELRAADPRGRLAVARRLAGREAKIVDRAAELLAESLPELSSADPGLAWETAGVLGTMPDRAETAGEWRRGLIDSSQPLQLLTGIQDRGDRLEAIEALRSARAEEWPEIWSDWLLHETHPALLDTIASRLELSGDQDALDGALEAVFRNHIQHAAQFIWACEAMTREDSPEPLRRRLSASLLEKLPDTLTKPEFGPMRGRAKALLDGGEVAVRVILDRATPQQAERFVQRLRRISNVEPQRIKVLEHAATQSHGVPAEGGETLFVASAEAIEAKRAELERLLELEIPKTLKGINAAAAEGDLRENFEYHMLRDRQELLSARAAKLQQELGQVRMLDPGSADTSKVNIGTVITFDGLSGEAPAPITILGAWDADIGRRVFANGSGIAQQLLGRRVGDEVELEGRPARISRIEPWTGSRSAT